MEPLYHITNPKFEAIIFRRFFKSIVLPGGLYQRSLEMYPQLGARYNKQGLVWEFPSGAHVRFAYLQYDSDVEKYKSSEMAVILFDEVTELTKYQFFYMFSRNRSVSGVAPYIRAYCNPDADSWAKTLLAPWVDDTWPARDRAESGEVRYFIHRDDVIQWVGPDHTDARGRPDAISLTFVAASLYDNLVLMRTNPEYEAMLDALPELERQRLKYGDWNIRPGGKMFKREWFPAVEGAPDDIVRRVRFWDKAATAKREGGRGGGRGGRGNDPDYTASVLMGRRPKGAAPRYVILDATWHQVDPADVELLIRNTASQDGLATSVRWEQEGGASGKQDSYNFATRILEGFDADGIPASGSKVLRARPLATQAKFGNVAMVRGPWNEGFLNFLVAFPSELVHDDPVDACSGAFNFLYLEQSAIPLADEEDAPGDWPPLPHQVPPPPGPPPPERGWVPAAVPQEVDDTLRRAEEQVRRAQGNPFDEWLDKGYEGGW